MKQLTKAEEDIMQILWDLGEGNVASIIDELPEPQTSLQYRFNHCANSGKQGVCRLSKRGERPCLFSDG